MDFLLTGIVFVLICLLGYVPSCLVKSWVNPVSIFVFVWGLNLVVFCFVKAMFVEVTMETWLILSIAFFAFYSASISFLIPICNGRWLQRDLGSSDRISSLRGGINKKRMRFAIYFLIFGGGIFFVCYLILLVQLQGFKEIFFTLLSTRAYMKEEGVLLGFHFFYFWEMLLPLMVLYILVFGKNKEAIVMSVVVVVLTFCLLLTGAKTNIYKAFVWSFVLYSLLKYENIKFQSLSLVVGFTILAGVGFFFIYTGFTKELQGFSNQGREVIYRFSAQFPTFHSLINDSSVSHSYGKLLFLPVTKLAHIFIPEIQTPSHILEFYDVPLSFNLATYLDVFYKDFGLIGVVLFPWLFGIVSAYIFYVYTVNKRSFFVLFIMSIILLWIMESSNASGFIKPDYWFQIIFGYVMYLFVRVKKPLTGDTYKMRDLP